MCEKKSRYSRIFGGVVRVGTLVLLATVLATPVTAFDDFQTWSTVTGKYLQTGKWTFGVGGEIRLEDDSSSAWFGRISHHTRYEQNDTWAFDGTLSYIRLRAGGEFDLDTLRVELAATPKWSIGERSRFDLRMRLDYWAREGSVDEDLFLRVRPRLTVRLGAADSRRSLFFASEGFASLSQGKYFQNRFYPIGASLPVGSRARVELYLMVFSLQVADDWQHDLVLGQSWYF